MGGVFKYEYLSRHFCMYFELYIPTYMYIAKCDYSRVFFWGGLLIKFCSELKRKDNYLINCPTLKCNEIQFIIFTG